MLITHRVHSKAQLHRWNIEFTRVQKLSARSVKRCYLNVRLVYQECV